MGRSAGFPTYFNPCIDPELPRWFIVIHTNLLPGQKSTHEIGKVWYDIVYHCDDGKTYENAGVYFGGSVVGVVLNDSHANQANQ